jgi:hypothetical protein
MAKARGVGSVRVIRGLTTALGGGGSGALNPSGNGGGANGCF